MYAYGETVTVRRATQTGTDRYGNPVLSWTDTPVPGCAVAPGTSLEPPEIGRSAVITGLVVYFPAGTDIRASDRLVVRGREVAVDGDPADWRNPYTGNRPGIAVATKDVEG